MTRKPKTIKTPTVKTNPDPFLDQLTEKAIEVVETASTHGDAVILEVKPTISVMNEIRSLNSENKEVVNSEKKSDVSSNESLIMLDSEEEKIIAEFVDAVSDIKDTNEIMIEWNKLLDERIEKEESQENVNTRLIQILERSKDEYIEIRDYIEFKKQILLFKNSNFSDLPEDEARVIKNELIKITKYYNIENIDNLKFDETTKFYGRYLIEGRRNEVPYDLKFGSDRVNSINKELTLLKLYPEGAPIPSYKKYEYLNVENYPNLIKFNDISATELTNRQLYPFFIEYREFLRKEKIYSKNMSNENLLKANEYWFESLVNLRIKYDDSNRNLVKILDILDETYITEYALSRLDWLIQYIAKEVSKYVYSKLVGSYLDLDPYIESGLIYATLDIHISCIDVDVKSQAKQWNEAINRYVSKQLADSSNRENLRLEKLFIDESEYSLIDLYISIGKGLLRQRQINYIKNGGEVNTMSNKTSDNQNEIPSMKESLVSISESSNIEVPKGIQVKTGVKLNLPKVVHDIFTKYNISYPSYGKDGDSGFDLRAMNDTIIRPGERVRISTGISLELAENTEAQSRARSGIMSKTTLTVHPGTIDENYTGEISVVVENTFKKPFGFWDLFKPKYTKYLTSIDGTKSYVGYKVPVGTVVINESQRFAQLIIAPVLRAKFHNIDEHRKTDRGDTGFGDSGTD